jgi:hypothetical protein
LPGAAPATLPGGTPFGPPPGQFTPTGAGGAGGGGGGGRAPTGVEAERGGALYQKLLAEFRANPPQGVPPDGARFGITQGTPEEWARFGVSVAHAESGFNPRDTNLSDPGGSFGVFQYSHRQAYGNAYDIDNSVKAFVRDAGASSGGLRGGLLGQRFSTIGRNPSLGARYLDQAGLLAGRAADARITTPKLTTVAVPQLGAEAFAGPTQLPQLAGRDRPGAEGDPTVPASILVQAREVARLGPQELSNWMKAQGYPKHDNWCGDFVASVVKSTGGTPVENAPVATAWRKFGTEVTTPQPGDIAVRNSSRYGGYTPTGATGSHVTIVDSIHDGAFTGLGGNQRERFSTFNKESFKFFRPTNVNEAGQSTQVAGPFQPRTGAPIIVPKIAGAEPNLAGGLLSPGSLTRHAAEPDIDRSAIDAIAGRRMRARRALGSANVDVNVKAEGQKSTAQIGPFRKVRMERSTQMAPAETGPAAPEAASGGGEE